LDRKESELKKTDTAAPGDAGGEVSERFPSRSSLKTEELYLHGDELFGRGLFQRAVHVWTRILFMDRGNPKARKAIDRAKKALAERQRLLDAEVATAGRLFEEGDLEGAGSLIRAVLAADPRHAEGHHVAERIAALDHRNVDGQPSGASCEIESAPVPSKCGLLLRVSQEASARPETGVSSSPLKMAIFALTAVLVFAAEALYLHLNWDSFVSDEAFANSTSPSGLSVPEALSLPDPAELRYYNGARLFAKGRYREALLELSLVDRSSTTVEEARGLILRIEERLLRGVSEDVISSSGETK
jgi:hypothetical protein